MIATQLLLLLLLYTHSKPGSVPEWCGGNLLTLLSFSSVFAIIVSKDSRCVKIFLLCTFRWNERSRRGRETYIERGREEPIITRNNKEAVANISLPAWRGQWRHRCTPESQFRFPAWTTPTLGIGTNGRRVAPYAGRCSSCGSWPPAPVEPPHDVHRVGIGCRWNRKLQTGAETGQLI